MASADAASKEDELTDAPAPGDQPFWAELRQTVVGGRLDYTSGGLGRAVALLAVPMVLEMAMQSVFGLVDVYFVGKLGGDAIAVVGGAESMLVIVFAISAGLSMGTAATVARRIGEKDPEGASLVAAQALGLGILVSLPLAAVGVLFAPELLGLVNVAETAISSNSSYCAILLGGNVTVMLIFLLNAVFRGAGDAMISMKVLWLANILNMVLDPILIFGWGPIPAMGVAGAAVATVIGRGVGVAYQLRTLFRGGSRIRITRADLRRDPRIVRRLVRVSLPAVGQYFIGSAAWLLLYGVLGRFGSEAQAGYTVAVRVIMFALLPSWGMGNAAATLVGQNLGAGRPERAERAVRIAAGCNVLFLGVISFFFVLWAEPIVALFADQASVVSFGRDCLRTVSYSFVFFAFGMVVVQAFNGAGDTTTPTWINFFCYWFLQIPLAWLMSAPLGMGPQGVFLAITLAQSVLAVVSLLLFRRGSWKKREV